jgi:hypothetical protein
MVNVCHVSKVRYTFIGWSQCHWHKIKPLVMLNDKKLSLNKKCNNEYVVVNVASHGVHHPISLIPKTLLIGAGFLQFEL